MNHKGVAFASVLLLGLLILFSGDSFASGPRRLWVSDRQGHAHLISDIRPTPVCQSDAETNSWYPPNCGQTSGATAGGSSGSTAVSSSSTGTTSTTASSGETSGTTTSAGGSTGTTSGPDPGPTEGSTSTAGTTSGTTSTTSTTGTNPPDPTGGANAGSTAGASAGSTSGWGDDGSGPTIDGVSENGYVSGTKVEAHFKLSLQRPASDTTTTAVVLKSVDLQIGGEVDSTFTQAFGSSGGGQPLTLGADGGVSFDLPVRFASTRFVPNATITLHQTFHYDLQNSQGNHSSHDDSGKDLHVVVYNQGLTLSTQLYVASCTATTYTWEDPTDPAAVFPHYDWDSRNAIPSAGTALAGMNHSATFGSVGGSDPSVLSKASLVSGLGTMTAFFGYTHGESDGFFPSFGAGGGDADASDKLRFASGATSDVGQAVRSRLALAKPLPLPNLVVLHACSGLGSGSEPPLKAFGLMAPGESAVDPLYGTQPPGGVDRAIAAFDKVVDSRLLGSSRGCYALWRRGLAWTSMSTAKARTW